MAGGRMSEGVRGCEKFGNHCSIAIVSQMNGQLIAELLSTIVYLFLISFPIMQATIRSGR